jgi:hypothetical protein
VTFLDQSGTTRPSVNLGVQVWDRDDGPGADDFLKSGVTGADGGYKLCFDNSTDVYRGQDVYVKLRAENDRWRVQDQTGKLYELRFDGPSDLADGAVFDFKTRQPANSKMRAWHAFDEANDAFSFVPHGTNNCWPTRAGTTSCRQLVLVWTPGVVVSPPTYNGTVNLSFDTPDNRSAVVHEIGHFVMNSAYGDTDFNTIEDCLNGSHAPDLNTTKGCAWTEGFADWFSISVYNDPNFTQSNGIPVNFEEPTYGNGWSYGDVLEGRVAAALLDLSDSANEGPYDRFAEGAGPIFDTLTHHASQTFHQFWDDHGQSSPQALASVYQNTIDYDFRDPLADYGQLERDFFTLGPDPLQNYRYASNINYWSVAAVRPQSGSDRAGNTVDVDLSLYDDAKLTNKLTASTAAGSAIDFIAVDSNAGRRTVGDDYYPQASLFRGIRADEISKYRMQLAQGAGKIQPGVQPVTMQPADVVAVRDVYLDPDTPTRIIVTPANPKQNPEIYLMGSDPADPATWIRPRGTQLVSSTTAGPGQSESITVRAPRPGWYGFVILNAQDPTTIDDGGGGTYTVLREDLTPPATALPRSATRPAIPPKP